MKVIKCKDQEQVNFALKEIKVLLQLRNPNIVSYIDFFVVLERSSASKIDIQGPSLSVCLVMELCSEETFYDKIRLARRHFMETGGHAFKEADILSWMKQCTLALKYIHDRGFLHRDMKPTNVLFTTQGQLKLGDFGVATSAGLGKESTVGSPHYFAPELLLKQSYNNKVDVWGLGIVFLEMLTLRERPINTQLLTDPLENESVIADVVEMGFSRGLGILMRDMLARHPDGRPPTAAIISRIDKLLAPRDLIPAPLSIPHPSVVPSRTVCQLCEVDAAVVICSECKSCFCAQCELARHKHPQRQSHQRRPIGLALPREEKQCLKLQVPSDEFPTIASALAQCSKSSRSQAPSVEVVVASGFYKIEPLSIPSHFPSGVTIRGLDPTPVFEINSTSSCFVVEHTGNCQVQNIAFHQISRSSLAPDSRPCVLELIGSSWTFQNCKFSSDIGSGAIVTGKTANPTFDRCHFQGVKQIGALFTDSSKGTVRSSRFSSCEYSGILVRKFASPSIVDCLVTCGKETGIYCHESSPTIESTVVESNGGCGIVSKGSSAAPTILRCRVLDNMQAGIFCSDSTKPVIDSCEILLSRKVGILVKARASVVVDKCVVNGGKEAGMYIFESATARITNSTITGNANSGILVAGKGNVDCVGNVIRQNGYEGVWVCKGGTGQFTENDVRSNTKGPKDIEAGCMVQWRCNQED
ncbi:protein kinase, putative [Bodo saltans]|uniref:non-specific serine/threonine protein kinase n=1 Tax=Bodo saltans TaxID=75058 RepID=A0A0S4IQW4_BODSA|nr:protein kinase, putative [Bodo saltans]|eukprot:CUF25998.1 protein kinase, putative [Bodo saltans]